MLPEFSGKLSNFAVQFCLSATYVRNVCFEGFKVGKEAPFECTYPRGRVVVAYSVYLLDEPLSGTALRLGFGASFGTTEAGGLRSKGAWSVLTPSAEAVLMRCSPHSSGPKADSLLARLTFCSHSGQLLERCFAPMEFLD